MKSAALILFALVGLGACARNAPLQQPMPLQAARDIQSTEAAIHRALVRRGFTVQERQPGMVTALYSPRSHRLWIRIAYDQRAVQIYYLGSENLNESRVGNSISVHRKVNAWLENLQSDLANALAAPPPFQPGYPPPGQYPPPQQPYPPPGQYPPPQQPYPQPSTYDAPAQPAHPVVERMPARKPRAASSGGGLAYCQSTGECLSGETCKDRGDGIRLCMGKGQRNDFCAAPADCTSGLSCAARNDGLKVCQ